MLTDNRGKQIDRFMADYVLFDLETTGISANSDAIIEISAVKVADHRIVEEFSTLVNPQRPIPRAASMVNNISDDMVADAPLLEEVLPQFMDFIGDSVLAGHNIASFDMKFLYRDCERVFGKVPGNDFMDTLKLARRALPGMRHYRLVDLADHYSISTRGAHRALNDCRMNQQVLELLAQEMEKNPPKYCPQCQSIMVLRKGRFGEFWGCTGYPNCKHTENIRGGK